MGQIQHQPTHSIRHVCRRKYQRRHLPLVSSIKWTSTLLLYYLQEYYLSRKLQKRLSRSKSTFILWWKVWVWLLNEHVHETTRKIWNPERKNNCYHQRGKESPFLRQPLTSFQTSWLKSLLHLKRQHHSSQRYHHQILKSTLKSHRQWTYF